MTGWPPRPRSSENGAAARALTPEERRYMRFAAIAVEQGKLPRSAPSAVLIAAIAGASDRELGRRALREVGPIAHALIIFFGAVPNDEALERLHDAVRGLDGPALDAVEDLLGQESPAGPIAWAERMWRADRLDRDWEIARGPEGRLQVRASVRWPSAHGRGIPQSQ